ncbi:hypothetical protein APUTEX25_001678, partial [Auxenochlorella protothecoides]
AQRAAGAAPFTPRTPGSGAAAAVGRPGGSAASPGPLAAATPRTDGSPQAPEPRLQGGGGSGNMARSLQRVRAALEGMPGSPTGTEERLGFALAIAGAVFITVPRGVSIGEVCVRPSRMSWNTTKSTYQLKLLAMVPVYNPNYLKAHIEGELRVLFYNTEAGKQSMGSVKLPARSSPAIIDVTIDASDVPSDYILAILSQCSTFPEVLIFFLQGNLTARYLFQRQHLTAIDTYFLIDCRNGGGMQPDDGPPSATPAPLALERLRGLDPGWC